MGYLDYMQSESVQLLASEVESQRFGLNICRATSVNWAEDSSVLSLDLEQSNCDVVILRTKDTEPEYDLFEPVFVGIPAGDLVYWVSNEGFKLPELSDSMRFISARESLEDFLGVIEDSFKDYVNHYSYNPIFSSFSPVEAYLDWAKSRAMSEDPAVVAGLLLVNGRPVGAVSGNWMGDDFEVELAGVHSAHQGQGLYAYLLAGLWNSQETKSMSRLVISTQSQNVVVQSAWRKLGLHQEFEIFTTHLVRANLQRRNLG